MGHEEEWGMKNNEWSMKNNEWSSRGMCMNEWGTKEGERNEWGTKRINNTGNSYPLFSFSCHVLRLTFCLLFVFVFHVASSKKNKEEGKEYEKGKEEEGDEVRNYTGNSSFFVFISCIETHFLSSFFALHNFGVKEMNATCILGRAEEEG